MAGADDDSAAKAAQFAGLLASQAAAALELFSLFAAELADVRAADQGPGDDGARNDMVGHGVAGDATAWVRSAERIEALWRQFLQDNSEAFVAAWPDIVRNVIGLLPLLSRGQPLFAMLAQLLPLLAGPHALNRAIESRGEGFGESLAGSLEQFLADLGRDRVTPSDPAAGPGAGPGADPAVARSGDRSGDPSGPDRPLS